VLVSSHDRNAAVFTFRGANTLLEPENLKPDAFEVDVVYITTLSNESADCYPLIVEMAKKRGALVAANPGVRQLSARGGTFQQTLSSLDVLAINRAEAEVLVTALVAEHGEGGPQFDRADGDGLPRLAERGLNGGGFKMSLRSFLRALIGSGAKCVLLTDGREGAFVANEREVLHCPSLPAEIAGTAGAGDAFTATYTVYTASGVEIETALRAATINAAGVLGHVDTQTGLMTKSAVDAAVQSSAATALPLQRWPL
jgi:ribokinase